MLGKAEQPAIHKRIPIAVTQTKPTGSSARKNATHALRILGGSLAALLGLGWLGLQVQPASFPPVPQPSAVPQTLPLPAGLPAPVERFYRVTYGDRVPLITSAVLSGRGSIRLFGITFPARFRFTHGAGPGFHSYIELTFFGRPVMKANEYYLNGKGRGETPLGVDAGAKVDQATNVRVWGEQISWLPAMLLTDSRVRWEPIDDATALLVVPFGSEQERLVVRFDPATGKLQYVEAMRYKTRDSAAKTLWISGIWLGDRPWATFNIEETVYNVDVDTSLMAKGP